MLTEPLEAEKPRPLRHEPIETLRLLVYGAARLRKKELCSGPVYHEKTGTCCAWGVTIAQKNGVSGPIKSLSFVKLASGSRMPETTSLIGFSDWFRFEDNDVRSRRARYQHVIGEAVRELVLRDGMPKGLTRRLKLSRARG